MYIYIYMCIRHRALRVRCDRAQSFAFRLLHFDFLLIGYNSPPPDPDGQNFSDFAPPMGRR